MKLGVRIDKLITAIGLTVALSLLAYGDGFLSSNANFLNSSITASQAHATVNHYVEQIAANIQP